MGESMAEQLKEKLEEKGMKCCHCHQKATPRSEKERKQLQNRLSRMTGQLNGISRMLEENRYCGDILTQVAAAVESALQAFGYAILKEYCYRGGSGRTGKKIKVKTCEVVHARNKFIQRICGEHTLK